MAQVVSVSIYGVNSNAVGTSAGRTYGFSVAGIVVEPAAGEVFNGVTMNSVIKALPDSAYRQADKYYSAATVSTIVSAANA